MEAVPISPLFRFDLAAHARNVSLKLHLRNVLNDFHALFCGQLAAPHLVEALAEELALEAAVAGRQTGIAAAVGQLGHKVRTLHKKKPEQLVLAIEQIYRTAPDS